MLGFAQHMPKAGWDVSVLTRPRVFYEPIDEDLAARIPSATNVNYVDLPQTSLVRLMQGVLEKIPVIDFDCLWNPTAWAACRKVVARERPDAVLTSSPPHSVHLLGRKLKRYMGIPWVADFRDPWVAGRQRNGRSFLLPQYLEKLVMRDADLILANAPNALGTLQDDYPEYRQKMISLTNGYDPGPQKPPCPPPHNGRAITILHCGELYAGRDPRGLLEALRQFTGNGQAIEVVLLGRNHGGEFNLCHEIEIRGLSRTVRLVDQVAYARAKQAAADADILLLIDAPGRKIGVPAKLYEYFGAGRPILALAGADGDTASTLRASGVCHRVADPTDVAGIKSALQQLVAELAKGKSAPRDTSGLAAFTREAIARQLAQALDRIVASPLP
jgi:hypothetical protein